MTLTRILETRKRIKAIQTDFTDSLDPKIDALREKITSQEILGSLDGLKKTVNKGMQSATAQALDSCTQTMLAWPIQEFRQRFPLAVKALEFKRIQTLHELLRVLTVNAAFIHSTSEEGKAIASLLCLVFDIESRPSTWQPFLNRFTELYAE